MEDHNKNEETSNINKQSASTKVVVVAVVVLMLVCFVSSAVSFVFITPKPLSCIGTTTLLHELIL